MRSVDGDGLVIPIDVEYDGKSATLDITEVDTRPGKNRIRVIVVDTDLSQTYLADVNIRREKGVWSAKQTLDVENDSLKGGHHSKEWGKASGLRGSDGALINEFGLDQRVLSVIQTVESVFTGK